MRFLDGCKRGLGAGRVGAKVTGHFEFYKVWMAKDGPKAGG